MVPGTFCSADCAENEPVPGGIVSTLLIVRSSVTNLGSKNRRQCWRSCGRGFGFIDSGAARTRTETPGPCNHRSSSNTAQGLAVFFAPWSPNEDAFGWLKIAAAELLARKSLVIPFRGRLAEGVGSRFREGRFPRSRRVGGNDSRPHPRWSVVNGITIGKAVGRRKRLVATAGLANSPENAVSACTCGVVSVYLMKYREIIRLRPSTAAIGYGEHYCCENLQAGEMGLRPWLGAGAGGSVGILRSQGHRRAGIAGMRRSRLPHCIAGKVSSTRKSAVVAEFHEKVEPILSTYCYECHGRSEERRHPIRWLQRCRHQPADFVRWSKALKNVRARVDAAGRVRSTF